MDNEAVQETDDGSDDLNHCLNHDDSSMPLNGNPSSRTGQNLESGFKQTTPPNRIGRRQNVSHESDCPLNEENMRSSKDNRSPTCKLYVKARLNEKIHTAEKFVLIVDKSYLKKCDGIVKIVQIVLSTVTLVMLATAGRQDGGLLQLPLSWHYRSMLFVLILTILSSILLLLGHVTNLISLLPIDWILFDLVLYSVFTFLYLVGTSLVASAFDFYDKMNSNVSKMTLNQLVVCIVLGYICMLCYGLTAVCSYRMYKIQYNLYQRKRLIEEEEFDI